MVTPAPLDILQERGWLRLGHDPAIARWAKAAFPLARAALAAAEYAQQWVCEGTWFVGLDVMSNAPDGSVNGVPLAGAVIDILGTNAPPLWHRAQVSVVRPGYPRPRAGESDAAFRYRRNRDAAHLDGLLPVGTDRRRMLKEPHAFILGLPLNCSSADASPLVVWEGSHRILLRALGEVLAPLPPDDRATADLTGVYKRARQQVFDTCTRHVLHALPGEAILLHRATLHGVAPWHPKASAPDEGRVIAYFRPPADDIESWLHPAALPG